jgi:hydrogenase nickel incorporation protein HypA/HybF
VHEVSLAQSVLDIVERAASAQRFARVTQLTLEVGALAAVDPAALQFALEAVAHGSLLEGAQFTLHTPPGRAFCFGCAEEVSVLARGHACPRCGSYRLHVTQGDDVRVVEMIVWDD